MSIFSGFSRAGEGAVMGEWPVTETGEPVAPAFLASASDLNGELDMTRAMLASFGIASVMRYHKDGEFGAIVLGVAAWGGDIFVPETLLEDAKNVINSDYIEDNE